MPELEEAFRPVREPIRMGQRTQARELLWFPGV